LDGPISDTGELLRGVRADARERYYKTGTVRYIALVLAIALLLAVAVIGLAEGGLVGNVLALGGALGILLVSIWLILH
jgi:hypothetical protein